MTTLRTLAQKHRAVLNCLADQDNPRAPRCSGCNDQHLCQRVRGVLDSDWNATDKLANMYLQAGSTK